MGTTTTTVRANGFQWCGLCTIHILVLWSQRAAEVQCRLPALFQMQLGLIVNTLFWQICK
jgi:hypothetical protein